MSKLAGLSTLMSTPRCEAAGTNSCKNSSRYGASLIGQSREASHVVGGSPKTFTGERRAYVSNHGYYWHTAGGRLQGREGLRAVDKDDVGLLLDKLPREACVSVGLPLSQPQVDVDLTTFTC